MNARKGKFQGYIGRTAQYAVCQENDTIFLYLDKETEPCFETTSLTSAEKFAGVIGYRETGRGLMPLYND